MNMPPPLSPAIMPPDFHQPYPSPVSNTAFFHSYEELSNSVPLGENPHTMQRSTSDGYAASKEQFLGMTPSSSSTYTPHGASAWPIEQKASDAMPQMEPGSPTGFEGDAFAPLWQNATTWGTDADKVQGRRSPWAGFVGQSSIFGRRQNASVDRSRRKQIDEEEMMNGPMEGVEEEMEIEMELDEKLAPSNQVVRPVIDFAAEEDHKRGMGMGLGFGSWDRGRRKRTQ